MEKQIISIGFEIPGHSELTYDYSTNQSLLDADIVLFEPDFSSYSLDDEEYYAGKLLYDKNSSFELKEDSLHWRQELSTALEAGKTVFVFFKKFEEFYVYTAEKEYSGTGRSARVSAKVTGYHNYHFLPLSISAIIPKTGKEIIFKSNPIFSTFWNEFKDYLRYESYIEVKVAQPLFLTRTGEKVVGALFKVGKGNLVLLPPIVYDEKKFVWYDEKKDESFWTAKAEEFGKRFLQVIIDIDKALRSYDEKTPAPAWLNSDDFALKEEQKIKEGIKEKSKKIDNLISEKNDLLNLLNTEVQLKDLLFEKGKLLEKAIIQALKIIGYKAENYDDGSLEIDQVIMSPEGDRYIGEAEGKDNSAVNIDKFRQLTSNIQEDLQRESISEPAIGILFGNGYRLTKPSERKEQFTEKCINTAKKSNCILIRTADLFNIAKYIKENNDGNFAKMCRDSIKLNIGQIVSFPDIPDTNVPSALKEG